MLVWAILGFIFFVSLYLVVSPFIPKGESHIIYNNITISNSNDTTERTTSRAKDTNRDLFDTSFFDNASYKLPRNLFNEED